MLRRTALRLASAVKGRPITSMVVMGLLGATVAATAIAATSEQSGGPITAIKVVRSADEQSMHATTFTDVPGASTTITVPSGQRALIVARFEASTLCIPSANDECSESVRILIGGAVGAPADSTTWQETRIGESYHQETHEIERSRGGLNGLPAGTYEVKVQAQGFDTSTFFDIEDSHLTVERSQIG
jgi:hypothetical protein